MILKKVEMKMSMGDQAMLTAEHWLSLATLVFIALDVKLSFLCRRFQKMITGFYVRLCQIITTNLSNNFITMSFGLLLVSSKDYMVEVFSGWTLNSLYRDSLAHVVVQNFKQTEAYFNSYQINQETSPYNRSN